MLTVVQTINDLKLVFVLHHRQIMLQVVLSLKCFQFYKIVFAIRQKLN